MVFTEQIVNFFHEKEMLEKVLRISLIVILGYLFIKLLKFFVKKVFQNRASPQVLMVSEKMISYSGFTILIIVIFSELGIQLSAILGAAGIMGIALGIASQKSLGNIISGFFMVSEKSFEIGDVIRVGEKTGIVHSVELLSIFLRTFDNTLIRIPNEVLISTEIVNITRFPIRRMDMTLLVSYKEDLNKTMALLNQIASENVLCLDEPSPFILIKDLADSGIMIQYGVWFEKTEYKEVRNSLMSDIIENFRKEGITIPYPHITIENGQE